MIIKSSEISSYLYCPVSWWLTRTQGFKKTDASEQGVKHHELTAKNQKVYKNLKMVINVLIVVIVLLIVYWWLNF